MKQFLRYEISGLVLIGWVLIFYYSGKADSLENFISLFKNGILTNKSITAFISAFPLGAIIHQFSVNIKNHIIAKLCEELDDYPDKNKLNLLTDDKQEYAKYIFEKISNLNSFYYVRFDNGFLSPFLALAIVLISGYRVEPIAVIIAIIIGVLLLYYIPRICKEIQEYNNMLKTLLNKKIIFI